MQRGPPPPRHYPCLSVHVHVHVCRYVYLALEWAPRGNLYDFLLSRGGRLSEREAGAVVVGPLLSALTALHVQSCIHR